MNRAAKGNACENRVAAYGESRGWLVAGRRHRKGGGDQVWWKPGHPVRLIECKASSPANPWENFRPAERIELLRTAQEFDCEAFLALSPGVGVPTLIPAKDWPEGR